MSNAQETALVAGFFGPSPGFFVEVGANDPHARSQTFHLEKAGWDGILVEPQPDLARELRAKRTAKVFEAACSSPANAGSIMPLHVAGPLSSLDRSGMAAGAQPERVIQVPVRTLDDILEEGRAPAEIDLLSIDVEGHELEVLAGLDLNRRRPKLILLEDHVGNLSRHRFMRGAGYKLIRRFDSNGWYTPVEARVRLKSSDIWPILRKYYLALHFRKFRNYSRKLRGKLHC